MQTLAPGWELDVRRGPGWLLVKVRRPVADPPPAPSLADCLWSLLESHFVYRLVLELDEIQVLDRYLLAQLMRLQHRIRQHNGVLRVCGLSPINRRILENQGLDDRLPLYEDLTEAVMGAGRKPR